jgi:hypothetical protein
MLFMMRNKCLKPRRRLFGSAGSLFDPSAVLCFWVCLCFGMCVDMAAFIMSWTATVFRLTCVNVNAFDCKV